MTDLDQLRDDVALANRIAHRTGLVNVWGHVSARVPGSDTFLIPPRASPALARAETLLVLDLDGNVLSGSDEPNVEFWIHARIYAARPDVNGVAHVHAQSCVILSQLGRTIRPIVNANALYGEVPVHDDLRWISTREQGDAMAQTLGDKRAVLLRGHGANVVGDDVRNATTQAVAIEDAATANLRALQVSGFDDSRIRWITTEEAAGIRASLRSGRQVSRAWDYYAALAEGRI